MSMLYYVLVLRVVIILCIGDAFCCLVAMLCIGAMFCCQSINQVDFKSDKEAKHTKYTIQYTCNVSYNKHVTTFNLYHSYKVNSVICKETSMLQFSYFI